MLSLTIAKKRSLSCEVCGHFKLRGAHVGYCDKLDGLSNTYNTCSNQVVEVVKELPLNAILFEKEGLVVDFRTEQDLLYALDYNYKANHIRMATLIGYVIDNDSVYADYDKYYHMVGVIRDAVSFPLVKIKKGIDKRKPIR